MIRGIHGLFYSSDPEATRTFFRDTVKLPGSDIGEGWWIFDFAEGDLGVHPVEKAEDAGGHDISFYCDDLQGTVAELKSRGVNFTKDIQDHGYGLVTYFTAPGGITVQLYEPRYQKATARPKPAAAKRGAARAKAPARKPAAAKKSAKAASAKTTVRKPAKARSKKAEKKARKAEKKAAKKAAKSSSRKGSAKKSARKA